MINPNIVKINNLNYRIFTDSNNHIFNHIGIEEHYLIRINGLATNQSKEIKMKTMVSPSLLSANLIDLKSAVEMINKQIVTFAVANFQRGATTEYGKYRSEVLAEYEKRKKKQRMKLLQEEQR